MNQQKCLEEIKQEINELYRKVSLCEEQIEQCNNTIKTEKQAIENAVEAGMTEDVEVLTSAVKNLESAKRKLNKDKKAALSKLEELKIEYRALIITAGELWLTEVENSSKNVSGDKSPASNFNIEENTEHRLISNVSSNTDVASNVTATSNTTTASNTTATSNTTTASNITATLNTTTALNSTVASNTIGMPAYDSVMALEKTLAMFNSYVQTADRNYEEVNNTAIRLQNEAEVARLIRKYTVGEYSSTVNEELKALKEKMDL